MLSEDLGNRYLRLLGIRGRPSGRPGLDDIVRQHLLRVPFENVTKLLLGAGRITTIEEFLNGIENHDLGGTCYTSNPFLAQLLCSLGFEATLHGADMTSPNVHTAVRVTIDGRRYHVDAGNAAPFLNPIDLGGLPAEIEFSGLRYVLTEAGDERFRMERITAAGREPEYVVHGPARTQGFFDDIVLESFRPAGFFMQRLFIMRFFEDGYARLHNRTLTLSRAGRTSETEIQNSAELRQAVDQALEMPRCPVEQAVRSLESITGAGFF